MTRGQCGWLDLHCLGLAPFTTVPACPGADPNASLQLLPKARATQERRLKAVSCKALFGTAQVSDSDPAGPPLCPGLPTPLSRSTPTLCTCGGNPKSVRLMP